MQNQNQTQILFSWKSAPKFIQFTFEEVTHKPYCREDEQKQNLENDSPRKVSKVDQLQDQNLQNSYQPSSQIIDFQKVGEENQLLEINNSGKVIVDEITHSCIFISKGHLPTITATLKPDSKLLNDIQNNPDKVIHIELFLVQKSHSNQYQKYKVIKGAIRGITHQKLKKQSIIKFEKNRFNYCSIPQKPPRFIIVIYQLIQNKRIYKSIMISDEFTVLDKDRILSISNFDNFKPYFQLILPTFLDKTGTIQNQKINFSNKYKIIEEMGTFENYLIKKNKKIWNIVYAAHKYSHIIDLYFYNPQNKPKKQQFIQRWKQVIESFKNQQNGNHQKTCNYLHPTSKFILKINFSMRTVRFIISKQNTKNLSIIATQNQYDLSNKWSKFDDTTQMKQAYTDCYNQIQSKLVNQSVIKTNNTNNSQQYPSTQQPQKKSNHHPIKNDDQDFNQAQLQSQDNNSDGQYNAYSSSGYEKCTKKKVKKGTYSKKINDIKKNNNRENKYSTRGGNRIRNKQDTEDSNDKKNNIAKKIKQKQIINNNRNNIQGTTVVNPPFRVITPTQVRQFTDQHTQSIDSKMLNMLPYGMGMNPGMIVMKKPQDGKGQPTIPGMSKGFGIPMMIPNGMNPQMIGMIGGGSLPSGVQLIPMGNGMQLMMPIQMDKNQQQNQSPSFPGLATMGGLGNLGMFPFMGPGQGVVMPPTMMNQNTQLQQNTDKTKSGQLDKIKQPGKKQDKKDTFPPQVVQTVDLNQMSMMNPMQGGGIGVMPGIPMSQFMPMGIPGQMPGGLLGMVPGMPPGMMMNPMMQMPKPSSDNKQQGNTKNNTSSLPNPLFGSMPIMMSLPTQVPSQMPPQLTSPQGTSQNPPPNIPGMPLGMTNQFPPMLQLPQGTHNQGGIPLGYMMMNQEQLRQMNAQQLQMMMSKGMPGMMQIPKNDNSQQNKK